MSVTTGRFRSLHGFLTTFSTQAPVAIQVQHSSKSSTISAQRVIHMLDVSRGTSGIYGKPWQQHSPNFTKSPSA